MQKQIILPIFLAALALFSAVRLLRQFSPARSPSAIEISEAAGERLGHVLAAAYPRGGELLVLQDRGSGPAQWVSDREMAGLKRGIGPVAFTLVSGPAGVQGGKPGRAESTSAAEFSGWLKSVPQAVAVLSFVGIPADAKAGDLRGAPPLYALFYGGHDHWIPLLREQVLSGVVVPSRRTRDLALDEGGFGDGLEKLGYGYVDLKALRSGGRESHASP